MTWAQKVKESYGNKCAFCGATERLEAHHLLKRSVHPDLQYDVENGISLCHSCHVMAHCGNYRNGEIQKVTERMKRFNPVSCFVFEKKEEYKKTFITIELDCAFYAELKAAAAAAGLSVNAFIRRAIAEQMERDKGGDRCGRWVGVSFDGYADGAPVYYEWECSECGHEHCGDYDTLTSYCPDCGAKMDKEGNDEADRCGRL